MPSWVYEVVPTERQTEPVSLLKTSVIFLDLWPLLWLCVGHKGIRNLEKHQPRPLPLFISPPFSFYQLVPLPLLLSYLDTLESSQKLVFTAPGPLCGRPRTERVPKLLTCPICCWEITPNLSLEDAASHALSASVSAWPCGGAVGRERFVEGHNAAYELYMKTQHSLMSGG